MSPYHSYSDNLILTLILLGRTRRESDNSFKVIINVIISEAVVVVIADVTVVVVGGPGCFLLYGPHLTKHTV